MCAVNTGLGTGTWEMVDTLTGVCFHHGKVTIHLSSTGVNMDEGVNDFLHDFRDSRMGRGWTFRASTLDRHQTRQWMPFFLVKPLSALVNYTKMCISQTRKWIQGYWRLAFG